MAQTAHTTYLFTDIQGSSRLWESEPERMAQALARHDAITCETIERYRGVLVKMVGDGALAAFDSSLDAVLAAVQLQRALADPTVTCGIELPVRCGLHAGLAERRGNDFFGPAINRTARIAGVAHGGQVLLSQAVVTDIGERAPQELALRDLGLVRLRDLERPERVYQVLHPDLRQDFPPLRSLEATPNNLPLQASSFVGRERELAQVTELLGQTRLLTLLGPGGIGKTRLSLQAAADLMDGYPDGVWFVGLAGLTDARLVAQLAASILGIKEESGRPMVESLMRFVQDRCMLLILDNCEHLLHPCAELAAALLQSGPRVCILASSREPLRVAGETTYPVRSLSTPDAGAAITTSILTQYEAARLFLARVLAVQPDFQIEEVGANAVADICQRLDGIPLAIELAAGRTRALSVEQIAERLSDRFRLLTHGDRTALPRHQTMRASIDWSYELLTSSERILLRRLSVFAGGWTLEAAEAVGAGGEVVKPDVLDLLANLVEKSLVIAEPDQGRYQLLETVRQYAADRLRDCDEEVDARARHLHFFLTLAEGAEAHAGRPPKTSFSQLDAEWSNLLVAFESCANVANGARSGLALFIAIKNWLIARGYLAPGYRLALEALGRDGAHERDLLRSQALLGGVELGYLTGSYAGAKAFADESLAIAREIGDVPSIAEAHRLYGYACIAHGQPAEAREHFEASLALSRQLNDKRLLAVAVNGLAELFRSQRQPELAQPLYEEAVALIRAAGDRRVLSFLLCNLSSVLIESGRASEAARVLRQTLSIAVEIGSKQIGHAVLDYCAGLAVLCQKWDLAARFHGAAEAQARRIGYRREPIDDAYLPALVSKARQTLGAASFADAEAAGHALAYEEAIEEVRSWLDTIK